MTTTATVAKAVARDAERRARTALVGVLSAHHQLIAADEAITVARAARATAGPALTRAVDSALAAGITSDQLVDLGVSVPADRTRRRELAASRMGMTAPASLAAASPEPREATAAGEDAGPCRT